MGVAILPLFNIGCSSAPCCPSLMLFDVFAEASIAQVGKVDVRLEQLNFPWHAPDFDLHSDPVERWWARKQTKRLLSEGEDTSSVYHFLEWTQWLIVT